MKLCVPVQIYVNEKGKYRKVSPVIFTYVQIPTLALSKSGIRVEVDYFLSACHYKLPCSFTRQLYVIIKYVSSPRMGEVACILKQKAVKEYNCCMRDA